MPFLIRVPSLLARRLCLLTLLYLAFPLVIFFIGWLRPLWGVPVTLLLIGTLGILVKHGWYRVEGEDRITSEQRREFIKTLLWTWLPIALVTLQIGVGGFGAATEDWDNKHNLIFADLVRSSWPVIYRGEGTPASGLMLVYYLAYYLPGAAVGKLLGWNAANVAWQVWTQLGMLLVCYWLVVFAGARVRGVGALFLVFSGAELLGFAVNNLNTALHLPSETVLSLGNLDAIHRWNIAPSYYVLYGSNILQLFWAPQHLLAGWLGIALVLNRWNAARTSGVVWDGDWGGSALLGWSLLVFWSPLAALGVVPFLVALGVREMRRKRGDRAQTNGKLGAAILLTSALCTLIVVLYLAFRTSPPPGASPQRGEHLEFLLAPLWRSEGWHAFWRYGAFVLVEFGLLFALIWPRRGEKELASWRSPLLVGLVVLLVLPCFIYGFYNDLAMRASIPALAILFFALVVFFRSPQVSRARRIAAFVLVLCGMPVLVPYSRFLARTLRHGDWNSRRPPSAFRTIVEEYREAPNHLLGQYTGPTDSPFARFLAK